jgi:hypothetical protein
MKPRQEMNYKFRERSKFALLTVNNVFVDLPSGAFELSDGTLVLPGVPVPDIGIWKDWIGSIRMERLSGANLVLLVEEASDNPEILDAVHQRLDKDLSLLFYMLHLHAGIEVADGADLLCGSARDGIAGIRQMSQMPAFHQSKGWRRAPITKAWLDDAIALRKGVMAMEVDKTQFRRVIRGLNTLFSGLKETGQDRLHQFVRSLEALILPDIGRTEKQFAHRCQTFARAGDDTRALLVEAFAMRSDTEHLHAWDEAVQAYPADQREDVCWRRTRQIEHLACDAYARLLHEPALREHFRTDAAIMSFWKLSDDQRRALWCKPLDIAREPVVEKYDQWERAIA